MYIVHMSDTHNGKAGTNQRFDLLLADLQSYPGLDLADCIVVHSGDLLKDATPEYRRQALDSLRRLKNVVNRIYLCPGNHDCGDFWSVSKEKSEHFKQSFAEYIFHDQPHEFPVLHKLDDDHMLIGLDTNEAEVDNWLFNFGAEGRLGDSQCQKLHGMLQNPELQNKKILINLHHHPFLYRFNAVPIKNNFRKWLFFTMKKLTRRFRRMKDSKVFLELIQNRVDAIFFGHKHEGLDCSSESQKYGVSLALDAGSTTESDNMSDYMRYRVIDLNDLSYKTRSVKYR